MSDKLVKSKDRVKKFGEVMTPKWLVADMCDMVEKQWGDISDREYLEKRWFEPSFGTGNFIIKILENKFKRVDNLSKNDRAFGVLVAISSVYGVELLADNVSETINRIYDLIPSLAWKNLYFTHTVSMIIHSNLVQGDTLSDKEKIKFVFFKPDWNKDRLSVISLKSLAQMMSE